MGKPKTAVRKIKESSSKEELNFLSAYLKEMNKYPILTRAEERDLAKKMAEGDQEARDLLINSNLRFVVSLARRYQNCNVPLIDLINEGNCGLIDATKKYDYTRGIHFISYAVWWIKNSILKLIREQNGLVRLPINQANQLIKIKQYAKNKNVIRDEEIMFQFTMNREQLSDLINTDKDYCSLNMLLESKEGEYTMMDNLQDESAMDYWDDLTEKDLKQHINQELENLSEKEKLILRHRYGLGQYDMLPLREIGKKLNLTKERVRQIEKRALSRLRHPVRAERLKDFLYN